MHCARLTIHERTVSHTLGRSEAMHRVKWTAMAVSASDRLWTLEEWVSGDRDDCIVIPPRKRESSAVCRKSLEPSSLHPYHFSKHRRGAGGEAAGTTDVVSCG